jgi:hypothetical protein
LHETCDTPEEVTVIFQDLMDNGEANTEKGFLFVYALRKLNKYIEALSGIKTKRAGTLIVE